MGLVVDISSHLECGNRMAQPAETVGIGTPLTIMSVAHVCRSSCRLMTERQPGAGGLPSISEVVGVDRIAQLVHEHKTAVTVSVNSR